MRGTRVPSQVPVAWPRLYPVLDSGQDGTRLRRVTDPEKSPCYALRASSSSPARTGGGRSWTVERLVAPNSYAMPVPLRMVVPHGVMLDAAAVPEGDGALLPAET